MSAASLAEPPVIRPQVSDEKISHLETAVLDLESGSRSKGKLLYVAILAQGTWPSLLVDETISPHEERCLKFLDLCERALAIGAHIPESVTSRMIIGQASDYVSIMLHHGREAVEAALLETTELVAR